MKKLFVSAVILAIISLVIISCQQKSSNPVATTPSDNLTSLTKAETYTENIIEPLDSFIVYVECTEDSLLLNGTLHTLYHYTNDGKGGYHVKFHAQPQHFTGVSLITGDKFEGTGVTQDQFNAKFDSVYTYINNFRMIGQGPNNNYLVHETYHITINANGILTAEVDKISIECR